MSVRIKLRRRRRTKIIATLGPASSSPEMLARVASGGAGIAAFLAASPNSYRRLTPSVWAGAFQVLLGGPSCWGAAHASNRQRVSMLLYLPG